MTYLYKDIRGLYIGEIFFFLLTFILTVVLYRSNQFKDGILNDLSHNWKLSPIKSISKEFSEDNDKNRNLGIYNINQKEYINKWRNITLKIETMDLKYTYYNIYSEKNNSEKKECGTDDEGNYLFFPRDVDCPLNCLEITDSTKSNNCKNSKMINLTDNKFLHYSNENNDKKIIVQFQISQHYPCPNIDYDNNFCPALKNCENKNKGCNIVDYLSDKYIYEYVDSDLASKVIKYIDNTDDSTDNNILDVDYKETDSTGLIKNADIIEKINDGNYYAYNSNNEKIFILYKRSWIGYYNSEEEKKDFQESKSKLKNFTFMKRFCKRKNRALLAFSILILFLIIGKYIFYFVLKTQNYLVYLDFSIIIFLFINWVLNSITIRKYNSFNYVFFKFSVFNYFNHNEHNITKIEISLLFFNLVFFILEFVLFFYDFSQTENYLINCWNKCRGVENINTEHAITDADKKLITPDTPTPDIDLHEISRMEIMETEKLKNMSKQELIEYFRNKINKLMNNNNLDVIKEEENEENESSQNISYGKIDEVILNTNQNDQNAYESVTIETITNNNNSNNMNNNTELLILDNNFSHIISNVIKNEQKNENYTPHGNFGFIKTFVYKGKNFALKIPNFKDNLNEHEVIQNIVEIQQLENEIFLLKSFKHKNIVRFYYKKLLYKKWPCMLLENCQGGDLKKVLENNRTTNKFKEKMMKELAEALIYLHENGYVHSDLKCDNILLDKPYDESNYPNLKLADFGCSVKIGEKYNMGHVFFRAIEIIYKFDSKVTDKIDVYSYASTCYQIIKEKEPFDGDIITFKKKLMSFQKGELKNIYPDIDDLNCSDKMKDLLRECWNFKPENRPDMKTVLKKLNEINIF